MVRLGFRLGARANGNLPWWGTTRSRGFAWTLAASAQWTGVGRGGLTSTLWLDLSSSTCTGSLKDTPRWTSECGIVGLGVLVWDPMPTCPMALCRWGPLTFFSIGEHLHVSWMSPALGMSAVMGGVGGTSAPTLICFFYGGHDWHYVLNAITHFRYCCLDVGEPLLQWAYPGVHVWFQCYHAIVIVFALLVSDWGLVPVLSRKTSQSGLLSSSTCMCGCVNKYNHGISIFFYNFIAFHINREISACHLLSWGGYSPYHIHVFSFPPGDLKFIEHTSVGMERVSTKHE